MTLGQKIDPAVWYRADWEQCDDWIIELTEKEIRELKNAVSLSQAVPIVEMSACSFTLPSLASRIRKLRNELIHGRGFGVLRGLPVYEWDRESLARAYYGIGCHLGVPVSQNAQGHLLGHVCDLGLDPMDPVNRVYQTNYRQLFHTDSTDIVGLLCLQPARMGGQSSICSSSTIYHEIAERRPDLLKVLCQRFHIDRKGEIPQGEDETYEMAVFYPDEERVTCIYARDFIDAAQRHSHVAPLTTEQVDALNLMDELAASGDLRLDIDFLPGDIQFLHNHQILHARTSYEDWPEPERRRHLLRLWLSTADGRSLPADFEARYGKIEQGQPRGGISVPGATLQAPLEP
ncbi:MAG: TauD/TfdA family dioxygenase [Arenicellales bacterium]|jgi:hypothetical protein|nr:TauD/TfdA family dioxygenase [Arenicellales bacterium]